METLVIMWFCVTLIFIILKIIIFIRKKRCNEEKNIPWQCNYCDRYLIETYEGLVCKEHGQDWFNSKCR